MKFHRFLIKNKQLITLSTLYNVINLSIHDLPQRDLYKVSDDILRNDHQFVSGKISLFYNIQNKKT